MAPPAKKNLSMGAEEPAVSDLFKGLKKAKEAKKEDSTFKKSKATIPQVVNKEQKKKDGLYRKPEVSLEISDREFFNAEGKMSGNTNSSNEALQRKEGVDKIVSMSELKKMLSSSSKAGTTKNCPFDCDCCF